MVKANLDKKFSTVRSEVQDAVIATVEDAMVAGQTLDDVNTHVYSGQISTTKPSAHNLPAVFTMPESYRPEEVGANSEEHRMPYIFISSVQNNDVVKGKKQADDLASRVYDLFDADRTLGGIVQESEPADLVFAREFQGSKRRLWSGFKWTFIFRILKRS